jgi:hypothetical protein
MRISAAPERTFAIVVGIEYYDENDWFLPGPATEAMRYVLWLLSKKIPPGNIRAFVSAPSDRVSAIAALGVEVRDARRDEIYDYITKGLVTKDGDLLLFFWGGHGVVTGNNDRRLYYANASRQVKINLDLTSLLVMLRSSLTNRLRTQIFVVDACANHYEFTHAPVSLPSEAFPTGKPVAAEQVVLLAAKLGELASNEGGGAFSRYVLDSIEKHRGSGWPDFEKIALEAEDALKNVQSPTLFIFRNASGGERVIGTTSNWTGPTANDFEAGEIAETVARIAEQVARINALKQSKTSRLGAKPSLLALLGFSLLAYIAYTLAYDHPRRLFDEIVARDLQNETTSSYARHYYEMFDVSDADEKIVNKDLAGC